MASTSPLRISPRGSVDSEFRHFGPFAANNFRNASRASASQIIVIDTSAVVQQMHKLINVFAQPRTNVCTLQCRIMLPWMQLIPWTAKRCWNLPCGHGSQTDALGFLHKLRCSLHTLLESRLEKSLLGCVSPETMVTWCTSWAEAQPSTLNCNPRSARKKKVTTNFNTSSMTMTMTMITRPVTLLHQSG